MEALKQIIRDIPDFPKKGIIFKDIAPLLGDPVQFTTVVDHLKERYTGKKIDHVVGIEARGFIFAATLAYALGAGCVMV
ncbi:MAG: adenine phosphoribosyltransferase, partial [Nitrospinaceae bacterium]